MNMKLSQHATGELSFNRVGILPRCSPPNDDGTTQQHHSHSDANELPVRAASSTAEGGTAI